MGAPAPGNGCHDKPCSRGVGTPGVIWHRKVPPSGLWLCGSASTWQWRSQNTSTFHATLLRIVLHVPTPTVTLVRRHDAAAMSTGGATMVSSRHVDMSGFGVALGRRVLSYSLFAFASRFAFAKVQKTSVEKMFASGLRSDALLLGLATRTARSSAIRQGDSDGLMSFVGNSRLFRSRAHGLTFSGLKRGKCCPNVWFDLLLSSGRATSFP